MTRGIFLGLAYRDPYEARYRDAVARNLPVGWQAFMPLGGDSGGLMLDRIVDLIARAERAAFDVSIPNANVWVETGVAIARRKPLRLLADTPPGSLADVLRGAWLATYGGDAECRDRVRNFLGEPSPAPTITVRAAGCDALRAVVIGRATDTVGLVEALTIAGFHASTVEPATMRDFQEAHDTVADAGVVVLQLPAGTRPWIDNEAVGAWVALGIAVGLGRRVAIAAGPTSTVPSDCPALVCRGRGADLGALVVAAVSRPTLSPPPPGVGPPTLGGLQPRPFVPGLIDALRNASPVAVLVAEPGYAKTSSAVLASREAGWPTAWVTIISSQSATEVVEAVTAAVGQWVPAFGWRALSAGRAVTAGFPGAVGPDSRAAPERVAQLLAEDARAAAAEGPVLLVIDNAHLLPDGGAVLAELVRRPPPWLRILLVGWDIPSHLRQGHTPNIVRSDTLTFTVDETGSFLRSLLPDLSAAHVGVLFKATHGWPAALAMARAWLLLAPDTDVAELRRRLAGDQQDAYRLFAEAFWERVPDEDRTQLLDVGILPQLGPAEGGRFLGDRLAARRLAELPYFLSEQAPGVYRFHSLFAGFLRLRAAEERGVPAVQQARREAARWYAERGDAGYALNLAIESEDWNLAEEVLMPIVRALGNSGDGPFLVDMLEPLPADVRRRSRPIHETWVRALHYRSDPRGLEEARALVDRPDGSPGERAMAELLLIDLRAERGELDDAQVALAADHIADRLGEDELAMLAQARFKSFGARVTRDPDPNHWLGYYGEALAIAELAEIAGVDGVMIEAWGHAASTLDHMAHFVTGRAAADLGMRKALGQLAPSLAERVAGAKQVLAMLEKARELNRPGSDGDSGVWFHAAGAAVG